MITVAGGEQPDGALWQRFDGVSARSQARWSPAPGCWSAPALAASTRIGTATERPRSTPATRSTGRSARPARPGQFTCIAFRRVDVAKGTPGAYRYSIPRAARGPGGGYTPAALAKAYGFNPDASGNRQVVAHRRLEQRPDRALRPEPLRPALRTARRDEPVVPRREPERQGASAAGARTATRRSRSPSTSRQCAAVCHKCRIILVEADQGRSDRPGGRREHRGAPGRRPSSATRSAHPRARSTPTRRASCTRSSTAAS